MSIGSTQFLKDQYDNGKNLDIRIQLHQLYNTNKPEWHQWVFEQIDFHKSCKVIGGYYGVSNTSNYNRDTTSFPL
jgi:hypothetical protein